MRRFVNVQMYLHWKLTNHWVVVEEFVALKQNPHRILLFSIHTERSTVYSENPLEWTQLTTLLQASAHIHVHVHLLMYSELVIHKSQRSSTLCTGGNRYVLLQQRGFSWRVSAQREFLGTVPSAKRVEFAICHSLANISVIHWVISTSYISHWSSIFTD